MDFLFLDMCVPWKWEPFIFCDPFSCTNSKTLPNLELIWLTVFSQDMHEIYAVTRNILGKLKGRPIQGITLYMLSDVHCPPCTRISETVGEVYFSNLA